MKSRTLLINCCLAALLSAPVLSAAEDFLLYTPKPAAGDQVPASPKEGVLVRTVTVKSGDTLRNLSRKHIGVASWFPQVLLFNSIKNPDLIHPGEKLLFPVAKGQPTSAKKAHKAKARHAAHRVTHHRHKAVAQKPSPSSHATLDEQESYQRAKRAYLDGECRKALGLFDTFLRRFPNSNLAPDVSLYRADCLLRLSGE